MTVPDLFVTGAARSGTSLLDKLISAHAEIDVLSQPLPRLYSAAKWHYLAGLSPSETERAFPLNDLFGEAYRPPADFTGFLQATRFSPGWLRDALQAMTGFAGRYTPPRGAIDRLVPEAPQGFAEFVGRYLRSQARPGADLVGSKETHAEEFVPHLLQAGARVLLLVRDPRDLAASVFGARGATHAGQGMPLLFVLRQWRKSVAFALDNALDPRFRLLRYEDLVTDPDAQMASIAAWLGCGPFPPELADRPLRDRQGRPWPSNSSHAPAQGLSTASLGTGRATLPAVLIRAIETLCGPELRALGYEADRVVDPAAVLRAAADPCPAPRPALARYRWTEAALQPELRRLETLASGAFDPELHLFGRAFAQLTRPAARAAAPWRIALGGRASALIHDLARSARAGAFLLPANICPEVALAVTLAGRPVRFVDIDPETHAMRAETALSLLADAAAPVAGLIHARTYGALFDAAPFFAAVAARDPGLLIVDDRCACRPALEPDPGGGAHVLLYSTGYGKHTDLGGGGYAFLDPCVTWCRHELPYDAGHAAAVTEALKTADGIAPAEIVRRWPNWLDTRPAFGSWPALRAALAAERDRADAQKAGINAIYGAAIPRAAWLGPEFNDWRFCLRAPDKAGLLAAIFAAGGFASGHYRPAGRILGGPPAPAAEALYAEVVNLFNDRHMTPGMADTIARIVRRHLLDHAGGPCQTATP